ncbi:MAG: 50S ribosomal protein L4 [Planctomycetota bacterium]|nr:50S ribosomal protein L4 [Planctomycetota bacterium]
MGIEPITLKKRDAAGNESGSVTLNEAAFGGFVKNKLIHAAAVMYHANKRQGTHCAKTRAQVTGSTKKLYRQKGTGRARAGNRKSGTRVGGGVIHPPKPRDYSYTMPQKQRAWAVRAALLGKAKDGELHLLTSFADEAKTKTMVATLKALGLGDQSVLVVTDGLKPNVYKSARNIERVRCVPSSELTARDALLHKHVVMEAGAFERLNEPMKSVQRPRKPRGTRKADASKVRGAEATAAAGEG